MLTIDGSYKEGGGQIVRTAAALSAVMGVPVKITNIRAKRCTPGLKSQHICAITAVAKMCNAKTKGVFLGSKEIEFYPSSLSNKDIHVAVPTAASVSLVLQAILIVGWHLKKPITITIDGGATFGKWAPPITYTQEVLRPILSKIGYDFNISVLRHGFYPKGGAKVLVTISPPKKLNPFELQKQEDLKLFGLSIASKSLMAAHVTERQKKAAEKQIEREIYIKEEYVECDCPGSAVVLWGRGKNSRVGADDLGERGVPADKVGSVACDTLAEILESKAPIDRNLADQIMPYLAFAGGVIKVEKTTQHTETNIWVTEQFVNKRFNIDYRTNLISF
ncbi:MAG: RNA 3'-terminal phosphate cyclase [Candidatus Aenigmarchaeota archaeon]|nr:RNA 3'-terminal phosphate cyclase [Candidatus Aenigmarchaeota archaeon]